MTDAVITSDWHLGSAACEDERLLDFVSSHRGAERFIINGDLFENLDFRRLTKKQWKVLTKLRELAERTKVIFVRGNHDGAAANLSALIGVKVYEEYLFYSGTKRVLVMHGDQFDDFITKHPHLTWLGDQVYLGLQRIEPTHQLAAAVKKKSKAFMHACQEVRLGAVIRAAELGADIVCCGHTHMAEIHDGGKITYANSGSWTDRTCCSFLTLKKGEVYGGQHGQ